MELMDLLGYDDSGGGGDFSFLHSILQRLYGSSSPLTLSQRIGSPESLAGYMRQQAPSAGDLLTNQLKNDLQATFLKNQPNPVLTTGGVTKPTPTVPGTYVGSIPSRIPAPITPAPAQPTPTKQPFWGFGSA